MTRLRSRERVLRSMGIEHLSLFGSVARDEGNAHSDVDLAVRFDAKSRATMGVFEFLDVQEALAEMLGGPVDLVTEPARKPRLQAGIDRDRVLVF